MLKDKKLGSGGQVRTSAEAKRARKKPITPLRRGDRPDRHLTELLAQCRKDKRGQDVRYSVGQRLKDVAITQAPGELPIKSTEFGKFLVKSVSVDAVKVVGTRRPLNDERVHALEASIQQIGLKTPITVRKLNDELILVAGLHRLDAARRLQWKTIPCFTIEGDETESRLWKIAENLYRAELTVLERAEHIDELRALILQKAKAKVGQVAPPRGGAQPKDAGINRTAEALGFTREEIRRSMEISGISAEAKAEARKLGLDDNQGALLRISRLPTSEVQLLALKQIDERRACARAVVATSTDEKGTAGTETLQSQNADKSEALKSSPKNKVAVDRARLGEFEGQTALIAATTSSPATAPTDDLDIPPILDRRTFSPDDAARLAALTATWDEASALKRAWAEASTRVRQRFVDEVLWR